MTRLSLLKRNEKILYISQFFHSLIFTIPVLFLFQLLLEDYLQDLVSLVLLCYLALQ